MERGEDWIPAGAAIASITLACALIISHLVGYPGQPSGVTSLTFALLIVAGTALFRFLRFLWRMWRAGVPDPLAHIRSTLKPALLEFMPIPVGVLIIGIFMVGLTFLKSMIVAVMPFWADPPLATLDRILMIDPQALALALEPALPAIGLFYGLWHAVHLGGILWVLHWRNEARSRFIISFMLTWVIGMALAYAFSSAGPIFAGLYDPAIAPHSVRKAADFLWFNYQHKGAVLGGGISAFPSMHVALATWFALAMRERGWPKLGIAYALAIFAGSIILGWHYTADGIAGAGLAVLAHRISNAWLTRVRKARDGATEPLAASV